MKEKIRYGGFDPSPYGKGAAKALAEGTGDCTEFSDLMAALCRARSIPARCVAGLFARPGTTVPQHSWVEVHLAGLGWVPFDPTVDVCAHRATFETLGPWYLALTTTRNDEILDNFTFNVFRWWGDPVKIAREVYEVLPVPPAIRSGKTREF